MVSRQEKTPATGATVRGHGHQQDKEGLMTMGIIHALMCLMLSLLAPGTGRRRVGTRSAIPTLGQGWEAPREDTSQLPTHRSPYGLATPPVDGAATVMVRPYVVAAEQECARQSRRRLALVLAADFGIDLDQHVIGTGAVA